MDSKKEELKGFLLALLVICSWMLSAGFVVLAFFPLEIAITCGLINAVIGGGVFAYLSILGREEEGAPAGLMYTLPIVWVAIGIIWWIMRVVAETMGWLK